MATLFFIQYKFPISAPVQDTVVISHFKSFFDVAAKKSICSTIGFKFANILLPNLNISRNEQNSRSLPLGHAGHYETWTVWGATVAMLLGAIPA